MWEGRGWGGWGGVKGKGGEVGGGRAARGAPWSRPACTPARSPCAPSSRTGRAAQTRTPRPKPRARRASAQCSS
eukprot:scaffold36402_cov185-Isochrysis_galbana.AAC.1